MCELQPQSIHPSHNIWSSADWIQLSQTLHVYNGMYAYMDPGIHPNVGIYSSPMGRVLVSPTYAICKFCGSRGIGSGACWTHVNTLRPRVWSSTDPPKQGMLTVGSSFEAGNHNTSVLVCGSPQRGAVDPPCMLLPHLSNQHDQWSEKQPDAVHVVG